MITGKTRNTQPEARGHQPCHLQDTFSAWMQQITILRSFCFVEPLGRMHHQKAPGTQFKPILRLAKLLKWLISYAISRGEVLDNGLLFDCFLTRKIIDIERLSMILHIIGSIHMVPKRERGCTTLPHLPATAHFSNNRSVCQLR